MSDVSVIIVTYNSDWEKLRLTLLSTVKQRNISIQIIITDDGSEETFDENIVQLFKEFEFDNYVIVTNSVNRGTVLNISSALQYLDGIYTKTIAPGDYFCEELALSKWVKFMKYNRALVSFGDAIYYSDYDSMKYISTKGSPVNKHLYTNDGSPSKVFLDYILANDTILGAAQMMETKILKEYIRLIENKIIYAEDFMMRIMIFDGIKIKYYPCSVILYEYGTGISTSKNSKWAKLLHDDFEISNEIIQKRKPKTSLQQKYQIYLSKRHSKINKLVKLLYFPSVLINRLCMKLAIPTIPVDAKMVKAKWIEE